ncbi:hypothetical protein [Pinisolibacter aquiterrae]|uniref:hypothetical protein n=1 Tax=Pinisolibacter aquiterrae TaxID=2815579 RepID=UPI001C3D36D7|nr:hypothetical protein [Pinisolibacter aquiterrae]MBV5265381.1 hypothetical protein [Pinisolibacter aquiterrae]MCC8235242.1 hypothetical protein [Pinisolibacter aquiterrae]
MMEDRDTVPNLMSADTARNRSPIARRNGGVLCLFAASRAAARRVHVAAAIGVIASIAVAPLAENAVAASSGPGVTTEKRPALKVRRRAYEALSPAEQVASRNAAWFKVEPDRNVPAEKWDSPYCTKWDDACTRCTRDRATDRPQCVPIEPSSDVGSCERKLIACQDSDEFALMTVCSSSLGIRWREERNLNGAAGCDYSGAIDPKRGTLRKKVYFECQEVRAIQLNNLARPENVPGRLGYHVRDDGVVGLAFDPTKPRRGQPDIWCRSPQRYDGGWVIDRWRPGF